MKIDSDDLSEYIQAVLQGINKGISEEITHKGESETFSLSSPVKFSLGISSSLEAGGSVKIFVAGLHGEKQRKEDARIEFEVANSSATLFSTAEKVVSIWEKLSKEEKDSILNGIRTVLQNLANSQPSQNVQSDTNSEKRW